MNGCFAYALALYGLPPSMQAERRLMNRMALQPLELGQADRFWKFEFAGADASMFHFGGRHYTYTENVGYFHDANGRILSVRKNGEIVGTWAALLPFLDEELTAAAAYHSSTIR